MKQGFTILEHPADIGIEGRGETIVHAFEQAALGMMAIILELTSVQAIEQRRIELEAGDRQQLLVKWLTEILYLYDGQQFVPCKFHIETLTDTSLVAIVSGEPLRAESHQLVLDVKAVTYHQLRIEEEPGKATVRVYLDI